MSTEAIMAMTACDPELAKTFNYTPTTTDNYTPTITDNTGCTTTGTYWWPSYIPSYVDNTKRAFAVAKKLMAQKLVKVQSIDKFVKLVELIEAEL